MKSLSINPLTRLFRQKLNLVIGLVVALLAVSQSARADLYKLDNTIALNTSGSWSLTSGGGSSGTVPGSGDIAIWDSTISGANNAALGGGMTWLGIKILNPGGLVTIGTGDSQMLKLGGSGIDMSAASQNLTFNLSSGSGDVRLISNQTWTLTSGLTLDVGSTRYGFDSANLSLTLSGSGTVLLGANNGNGTSHTNIVGSGVTLKATHHQITQNNVVINVNSGGVFDINGIGMDSGSAPMNLNGTGISGGGCMINSSSTAADIRYGGGNLVLQSDSTINCSSGDIKISKTISGSANLTKIGAHSLLLNIGGTESLTGNYIISAGTLGFSQGGVLFNSASSVSIAAGAVFDVHSLNGSGSWTAGSTASPGLSAAGMGTTIFSDEAVIVSQSGGTVNLGTRPITLTWGGATSGTDTTHPCLVVFPGKLTLNNNPFTINGSQLGIGVYTLIQVPGGTLNENASPAYSVAGTAVASGSYAYAISSSSGTMILTVTAGKVTPTVTVNVGSYTYNGSPQGPNTVTFSPPGDSGTVTWSYAGTGSTSYGPSSTLPTAAATYTATASVTADSANNAASSSPTAFAIAMATPTVTVTVGTYPYNGSAQGPNAVTFSPPGDTGTVTWSYIGTGSTSYGPSSTRPTAVGTYTATASVTADSNNNAASSSVTAFAIVPISSFSGLAASQSVPYGTSSVTLPGKVSGTGPTYPANGETVTVTINGNQQSTTIIDSTGDFSINYTNHLSTISASATPYTISYGYGGDSSLFGVTNTSTTLTVTMVTPTVTVTVGAYGYNGSPQGPSAYTTSPAGDTGSATWSYVGTGSTSYGPSATPPTDEGTYIAQVALASDSNFNAASSSATAFTIGPSLPTMTQDTWPPSGADVAGSQATFTAAFTGATSYQWLSNGVPIPGATNPTLTLTNLQTTYSGSYSLKALNADISGVSTVTSTSSAFLVNTAPTADGFGNLVLASYQNSTFTTGPSNGVSVGGFTPTWTIAPGSLIYGSNPSDYGAGSGGQNGFANQGGAGGEFVLTDGQFPGVGGSYNIQAFATLGRSGGAVTYVTYTLPASASGYNITNIQVYGGWPDSGRDHQEYTISYSTVSDPLTFVELDQVFYQPPTTPSSPTATHLTFESATPGAAMATDVYALKFDFTTPTQGGDWVGYAEIQIFGTPVGVSQPPVLSDVGLSNGNLTFNGTGGSPGAGYTLLTTTNIALPLADWTTNSTGVFDGTGSFSASIPVHGSAPKAFFRLRTP
jgi:hypothetical protein